MATDIEGEKQSHTTMTEGNNASAPSPTDLAPSTAEPPSEQPQDNTPDIPPKYTIYPLWQKRLIVAGASIAALFSPLTAQIYMPALNALATDFHVTASQINLTVTTYMIFQGITPMFIGGLADTAGRRPAYGICFVVFLAANIGLALSRNYVSLLVVRCIQSAGSSSTVALCQAVVADIVTSAERGQYIGITIIPVVIGPSLGPVIGGLLTQYLGWRSIFWFLTIFGGIVFILMILFFPETCRALVGDGSIFPHPAYHTLWQIITDGRRRRKQRKLRSSPTQADEIQAGDQPPLTRTSSAATTRPKFTLATPQILGSLYLLFTKEIFLLLFYFGLLFAGFYAIATAIPSQTSRLYGLSEVQVGLLYLPIAGGSIVAAFVVGPALNRNYRRHARKMGIVVDKSRQMDLRGFPIERARLEIALPLIALSTVGMLGWGWALQSGTSIAVPCVLLFFIGVGLIGVANAGNVLVVDICPGKAGTVVAANNLTRCLLGAVFSAIILPLIDAVGPGWSYTIIAVIYVAGLPMLFVVMRKGVGWREELRLKEEAKKRKRAEKERKDRGLGEEQEAAVTDGDEDNTSPSRDAEKASQEPAMPQKDKKDEE